MLKTKYIIIGLAVISFSILYTLMIAILFSNDSDTIEYHLDSGFFLSLFGFLTLFIASKIDNYIYVINLQPSKYFYIFNFLISFIINALIIVFISWIFRGILKREWHIEFSFIRQQMILLNFLFIIILSYLAISYFTKAVMKKNEKLLVENIELNEALNLYTTRLTSTSSKKTVLILVNKIVYFKMDEGIIFAFDRKNKRFPLNIMTLNELEKKLNPNQFFRINRSEIININFIQSYEPYLKDRIAIKLSDIPIIIYTSNAKASAFKSWLISSSVIETV